MATKYVPLTDDLYNYMVAQRSNADDPVLAALQAETENLGEISRMAIGHDQASFMTLLVGLMGAKWALEVGTFTGTSSISIARGLAPGGKLLCFDQDFKSTSIARRYWTKAGLQEKIDLRLGNARNLLAHFRPQAPLDFVFIDADKESYDTYYEMLLPHVRVGGLIVFDNMLRGGEVVDPVEKNSPVNRAIIQLNRKLAIDDRVQSVLIPVADGLYICRKRPGPGKDTDRFNVDSRRLG
jgi:caffeoyl-CoA O-methyltransferase